MRAEYEPEAPGLRHDGKEQIKDGASILFNMLTDPTHEGNRWKVNPYVEGAKRILKGSLWYVLGATIAPVEDAFMKAREKINYLLTPKDRGRKRIMSTLSYAT